MINWYKCVYGDRVKVVCADGDVLEGIVESVTDSEEQSDLEKQEISLDIIADDGRHIGIYESEIKEVVLLNESELHKTTKRNVPKFDTPARVATA